MCKSPRGYNDDKSCNVGVFPLCRTQSSHQPCEVGIPVIPHSPQEKPTHSECMWLAQGPQLISSGVRIRRPTQARQHARLPNPLGCELDFTLTCVLSSSQASCLVGRERALGPQMRLGSASEPSRTPCPAALLPSICWETSVSRRPSAWPLRAK